jgi:hypothetical protein
VSIIKHKTTPGTIIENINMLFTHHKQTARIIIAVRRMLAGSAIMNPQDNAQTPSPLLALTFQG